MEPESQSYDRVMIILHWTIAIAIILVAGLELFRHEFARDSLIREGLKPFHQPAGAAVFVLVLMRLTWRLTFAATPVRSGASETLLRTSALAHLAIYALMLALPVVGMLSVFAADKPLNLGLAQFAFPLKAWIGDYDKALREAHESMAFALLGLAGLHAVAALWHHYGARDTILASMWPPARTSAVRVGRGYLSHMDQVR